MAKLQLKASPTFEAKVLIPVAGGNPEPVTFTFKHRTRDELQSWLNGGAEREDVAAVLDMASGWDLEDKFNAESVALLTQNYIGAARAIVEAYIDELTKAAVKN